MAVSAVDDDAAPEDDVSIAPAAGEARDLGTLPLESGARLTWETTITAGPGDPVAAAPRYVDRPRVFGSRQGPVVS